MRSALRRLARRLLISSQRAFRPSFSDSSAFLQRLRSCLLLATRSSISFSLQPFDLTTASLMVTSPYLFLHSSYRISPNRFSLATTDPHRAFCSSLLRCSSNFLYSSASLTFGHFVLFFRSGFFRFLALWLDSFLWVLQSSLLGVHQHPFFSLLLCLCNIGPIGTVVVNLTLYVF